METNNLLPSQVNQPEPPVQGEILVQAFTQSIPIDVWESQMQPPSHMVALAPNDLRHILTQRRQTQAAQNAHDAQSVRNLLRNQPPVIFASPIWISIAISTHFVDNLR